MPIYAYKCESCGHTKDVLQKISDAPLTECPACSRSTFSKQLTAAGFQLKGSGWYATDFRGGSTAAPAADASAAGAQAGQASESSAGAGDSNSASAQTPTNAAASTGAGACGASCACH